MNKIKISAPKLSLLNNIRTPPNSHITQMLEITYSYVNTHISKQSTSSMVPVIMSNYVTARIPDGSTTQSSHIETIHLPGISKQAIQIKLLPKMRPSKLISLGVLYNDG